MKEHLKKFLPLAFFAIIFILSNLFPYEEGQGSPINKACPQDITRIELVVQYNTPDILQSLNNVSFTRSCEKPSSFVSRYLLDNNISLPPFNRCPVITPGMKWQLDDPTKHIISIIQKMNRWHQSSDDEPSHFICS
jgi:hypothetical protein